jgi:hypothetical protein
MIFNATLLRLDPPPPAAQGPAVLVRCALTTQTTEQGRRTRDLGLTATHVLYVPLAKAPAPAPVVDGRVLVRADGSSVSALYRIADVVEHAGRTLGHLQLSLAKV